MGDQADEEAFVTVLVTGGGGFLGGEIVRMLLERGESVRSFSRAAYPELAALGVACVQGDLAEAQDVLRATDGVRAVFHVAAKAGVSGTEQAYEAANVVGTQNVIEACRAHGVERLVYTSTPSVVHGGGDVEGVDESEPYPLEFSGPYPRTKAIAEQMVLAANDEHLATVSIRPHLIWGPGMNSWSRRSLSGPAQAGLASSAMAKSWWTVPLLRTPPWRTSWHSIVCRREVKLLARRTSSHKGNQCRWQTCLPRCSRQLANRLSQNRFL